MKLKNDIENQMIDETENTLRKPISKIGINLLSEIISIVKENVNDRNVSEIK